MYKPPQSFKPYEPTSYYEKKAYQIELKLEKLLRTELSQLTPAIDKEIKDLANQATRSWKTAQQVSLNLNLKSIEDTNE